MKQITMKVEGMACGMCETHLNDAIRRKFGVTKVMSSHKKGETVIITESPISHEELKSAVEATGYRVNGITESEYEKKGLFGRKN